MIINFLGDSITEGACATSPIKNYVSRVGQILNIKTNNYGISGTRLAKQSYDDIFRRYFATRVDEMDKSADYVFVFGGTNDYGHGDAPIGEISDKTPDTFMGAVNDLIARLLNVYKKEQIIFILPLHRANEDNPYGDGSKKVPSLTLQGYVESLVEVLKVNGILYLDIREEMGKGYEPEIYQDGLHPNDNGHDRLAQLIARFIKDRLMK